MEARVLADIKAIKEQFLRDIIDHARQDAGGIAPFGVSEKLRSHEFCEDWHRALLQLQGVTPSGTPASKALQMKLMECSGIRRRKNADKQTETQKASAHPNMLIGASNICAAYISKGESRGNAMKFAIDDVFNLLNGIEGRLNRGILENKI